jgi:hypothetical protein
MKHILHTLLVCCSLLLMACPLQTQSPIVAKTSVPSWLIGHWVKERDGGGTGDEYVVTVENAPEGKIIITPQTEGVDAVGTVYHGVVSKVKGIILVSVYDAGDDELGSSEGYYHYVVERGDGDISLIPMKENCVRYVMTGVDLAAYVKTNANNQEAYQDRGALERYVKKQVKD